MLSTPNFGFLAKQDPKLVQLGGLAERYFRDDPPTALHQRDRRKLAIPAALHGHGKMAAAHHRDLQEAGATPCGASTRRSMPHRVPSPSHRPVSAGAAVSLVIDLGGFLRADPEARWASGQRARLAGVLSPNDIRAEENWPPSNDPSADSIAPPNTSAQAAAIEDNPPAPTPAPDNENPADDASKIGRLDQRRAHYASD